MLNPEVRRAKYVDLANRLAEKVRNYADEEDKVRYLRAVAHMQAAVVN